jgi:hypothetical protein
MQLQGGAAANKFQARRTQESKQSSRVCLSSLIPAVFGAATELSVMPVLGTCTTRRRGLMVLPPAATPAATVKVRSLLLRTGDEAEMLVNRPAAVGACGGSVCITHALVSCISIRMISSL